MSCGVGHRCGLDLALLWFWHRPVATATIRPLAWEPPYAMGVVLKGQKTKKKKKSVPCLYTNNEILEKEYKSTMLFKTAPPKNQIPGNTHDQGGAENYKTLIKEIKEY